MESVVGKYGRIKEGLSNNHYLHRVSLGNILRTTIATGLLGIILTVNLPFYVGAEMQNPPKQEEITGKKDANGDFASTKFAILYTGMDWRESDGDVKHPIDINASLVSTVKDYNHLIEMGYNPDNVFVLYNSGKPDFSDPAVEDISEQIKNEFSGYHNNTATFKGLVQLEKRVQHMMGPDDSLMMIIHAHGQDGHIYTYPEFMPPRAPRDLSDMLIDHPPEWFYPEDLSDMLNDNPSDNNIIILEACDGQEFLESIFTKGVFVSSSKYGYMWIDRESSFSEIFLSAMARNANDVNNDGKTSPEEAFEITNITYAQRLKTKKFFIVNEYSDDQLVGAALFDKIDKSGFFLKRE